MFEHGSGNSLGILKRSLGLFGTKLMRDKNIPLDPELIEIFDEVNNIVNS